jgi:hypothetical protein
MAAALRMKHTLPHSTTRRITIPPPGQTIGQLIAFIAQKYRAEVRTVSLDGCILNEDEPLSEFSDSSNQIFAFSKSARRPRSPYLVNEDHGVLHYPSDDGCGVIYRQSRHGCEADAQDVRRRAGAVHAQDDAFQSHILLLIG